MSVILSTQYLGLELKNPLVVSSCPLTGDVEMLRELEGAGAAAAVLPSLFEEKIDEEELTGHCRHEYPPDAFAQSLTYLPEIRRYENDPIGYLRLIERAKQAVSIPVIASLNGSTDGGWLKYAKLVEQAGADALELNIYVVPTDPLETGQSVEQRYVDLAARVRDEVSIAVSVKIGPYFSSIPDIANRLAQAGADGLVLFNRYLSPDIDVDTLHITPRLMLSTPNELWMSLRWIAILRDHVACSLAATSGVDRGRDVIKTLLAGADVAMVASSLLRHGPNHLRKMLAEIIDWTSQNSYQSLAQFRGKLSRESCANPSGFERANYMKAIASFSEQ